MKIFDVIVFRRGVAENFCDEFFAVETSTVLPDVFGKPIPNGFEVGLLDELVKVWEISAHENPKLMYSKRSENRLIVPRYLGKYESYISIPADTSRE